MTISTWRRCWDCCRDSLSTTAGKAGLWNGIVGSSAPLFLSFPVYSPIQQQTPALFSHSSSGNEEDGSPGRPWQSHPLVQWELCHLQRLSQFAHGASQSTHLVLSLRNIWLLYSEANTAQTSLVAAVIQGRANTAKWVYQAKGRDCRAGQGPGASKERQGEGRHAGPGCLCSLGCGSRR